MIRKRILQIPLMMFFFQDFYLRLRPEKKSYLSANTIESTSIVKYIKSGVHHTGRSRLTTIAKSWLTKLPKEIFTVYNCIVPNSFSDQYNTYREDAKNRKAGTIPISSLNFSKNYVLLDAAILESYLPAYRLDNNKGLFAFSKRSFFYTM